MSRDDARDDSPVKVLYIAGMNRSGSTLLGRLLDEIPSAVHVGELGLLLAPGFWESARCGCLRLLPECPFWRAVLDRAFGGIGGLDRARLGRTRRAHRLRRLPRLLLPPTAAEAAALGEYRRFLSALYRAVAQEAGARVVVDGSKDVLYGALLRRAPGLSVRTLHLVRDSRAVAHSYGRVKRDPPQSGSLGRLERAGAARVALRWAAANLLLEAGAAGRAGPDGAGGPIRLRYEDFLAAPAETLARLWAWAGEPAPALDFLGESPLRLRPGHTVAGNPDRFETEVRLRLDDAWRASMPPARRALVSALTLPLLLRYGYLRPRRAPRPIPPARVL